MLALQGFDPADFADLSVNYLLDKSTECLGR